MRRWFCVPLLLVSCAAPTAPAPSLPSAFLVFDAALTFTDRADARGWDVASVGVNRGEGCASAVTGTTGLKSPAASVEFPWSLPPTQIIRPGERFPYTFGPVSYEQGDLLDGYGYRTLAAFVSVPCG